MASIGAADIQLFDGSARPIKRWKDFNDLEDLKMITLLKMICILLSINLLVRPLVRGLALQYSLFA